MHLYVSKPTLPNPPISHENLSMNRLLNRTQWGESKEPAPVRIGLELMDILKVEWVIYLNIGFRVI